MKLHVGDAFAALLEAAQGFRWSEYAPFFVILAVQVVFLGLTTQLEHGWAMALVAPVVGWVGGETLLHYPTFFGFLSGVMGWVETFLYAVPGSVLIPMALLRLYARTDRALSLGAGAAARLAGAVLPTLLASLAWVGCVLGWQRQVMPLLAPWIRDNVPGAAGDLLAWFVLLLGGYLALSLLLYVPIAAVQARTNMVRALMRGLRFGLRALPLTLFVALFFGLPAIAMQYVLERFGVLLMTKVRPESLVFLLLLYVTFSNIASYFTYGTGARLYKIARGDE